MGKQYIKIFDQRIAIELSNSGFPYITEKINQNQTIYAFENIDGIKEVIERIITQNNYSKVVMVADDRLSF